MKFSALRSQRKKELKKAEKLLKKLTSLNESLKCSFKLDETNLNVVYSELKKTDLQCLRLPEHAYYKGNYLETYDHGFTIIVYKETNYTFYAKGYRPN